MTIERKLWGDAMHTEELSEALVHAFQANTLTKGKTTSSSFHQKSLPYRPNYFSFTINLRSHGIGQ